MESTHVSDHKNSRLPYICLVPLCIGNFQVMASLFLVDFGIINALLVEGMAGRNKHTWTIEEDAKLIEALLELHVYGKYSGVNNRFKPGYLKAVQQLLDTSKNHFNIVNDMVYGTNMSGFGWDTDKCYVTADAEVWDEYIKSHKGVVCSCVKPFPEFDNLCKIFGKDKATGHGATDLEEDVTEETQRSSHIDMKRFEDIIE
ncbi:unnamed protein product [Lactuca saligna]|uniref:Myb/SANT-like domain-containing protein n=1 Tax=Lactuca saligna TaxID=75948 RepID=A0AA35VJ02_LACSI|nr:unnamed protein product [Lactuca saligna]